MVEKIRPLHHDCFIYSAAMYGPDQVATRKNQTRVNCENIMRNDKEPTSF
jgi:hypothetical protein